MVLVPEDAPDEQVLDVVRGWVDALTHGDYAAAFAALGYQLAEDAGPGTLPEAIRGYRSAEYYPGVVDFAVTDWRTARGGNPRPARDVIRYAPNSSRLAGAVAFDLPLNGRWSDLRADFVLFEGDTPGEGYALCLEEIR